jgi:2Fe-2S ferredoxin
MDEDTLITTRVKSRVGVVSVLKAASGMSLMEAIRDGGSEEQFGVCGGCLACATCHVYVDPAYLNLLAPLSKDESDLLDTSSHRRENSRLSCQIECSVTLNGLTVEISPEG